MSLTPLIWDLRFTIWDLGFTIWDLGFGIWDLGFGIWDLGFTIWDLRFGRVRMGCTGEPWWNIILMYIWEHAICNYPSETNHALAWYQGSAGGRKTHDQKTQQRRPRRQLADKSTAPEPTVQLLTKRA